jgi:predicted SAM-dependent methyltransferase
MPAWVASPDIKIEFQRGAFRVSVPGKCGCVEIHDAAVLNLLRLPEDPDIDPALRCHLDAFRQIGAIVPATGATRTLAEARPLVRAITIAGRSRLYGVFGRKRREIRALLRAMNRELRRIAGGIEAFGPGIEKEFSLIWPLARCLDGLEKASAEMLRRREEHIGSQLRRIGVTRESTGLRLHLGSGRYALEGWINIGCWPAQLEMDLNEGLPFADGSADYVFFSHTLEHFGYPGEALAILKEIRRVLSGRGKVRIVVPDMRKCFKAYAEDDDDFFESRRRVWTWWRRGATRLSETLVYAGAGGSSEARGHKFGYDFATLRALLMQAGFMQIEESEYMRSEDPVLRLDDASLVAGATFKGGYYSLFVEAAA